MHRRGHSATGAAEVMFTPPSNKALGAGATPSLRVGPTSPARATLPVPVPTAGGGGGGGGGQTSSYSAGTSPSRDSGVSSSLSPSIRGRSESVVGPEGYKKTRRAIITANKEGVIVSCNNAARFLFGYPLGSMVGARVERLMPEPYASRHQAHLDAHVASGGQAGSSAAFGAWKVREALGFKVRCSCWRQRCSFPPSGRPLQDSHLALQVDSGRRAHL